MKKQYGESDWYRQSSDKKEQEKKEIKEAVKTFQENHKKKVKQKSPK